MYKRQTIFMLIAAMLLGTFAFSPSTARAQTLQVGDPAPELYISKWVRGDAVSSFEKGKVYVIDCWATWCGPCIAAMPHLSKLNTKFKDKNVVVVAVNIWDSAGPEAVEQFVKDQGKNINFRVAIDEGGRKGKTAEAWMTAAGRRGIPSTFVVDQSGTLVWMGHPMGGLDDVVEQVVAGDFDPKKEAEKAARMEAFSKEFGAAAQAKDWDKALGLVDQMLTDVPSMAERLAPIKFAILLTEKKETDKAYTFADAMAGGALKDKPMALGHLAFIIIEEDGVAKRDLDRALTYVSRAAEATKHENPQVLGLLARAHEAKGDLNKAIEVQTLAVEKATERRMKLHFQNTLEQFKKKLAAQTQ